MIFVQPSADEKYVVPFDLRDRGLLLADGVFDTSLLSQGRIFLREAHISRLLDGASALGISLQRETVDEVMDEACRTSETGALRITITRGAGARGVAGDVIQGATVMASITQYDPTTPLPALRIQESQIQRNPTSVSARYKTLSYTDNIAALRRAMAAGFDDAFFFTPQGHLACATAANVFVQIEGAVLTPPASDGALPGVMRNWILAQGQIGVHTVLERSITKEDLNRANRVFLTNSLRLFQPVSGFEHHAFSPDLPEGCDVLRNRLIDG